MGKGNKHRGGHSRDHRDRDRGDDKAFAQQAPFRSFGGGNQRHGGTIGGALGQAERHSEEHHNMITTMKDLRGKADVLEKKLLATPDYQAYAKAKREMLDLERKLKAASPDFGEFQKLRISIRSTSAKFDEAKGRCKKCNFANAAQATPPVPAPAAVPVQPAVVTTVDPGIDTTRGADQTQTA